MMIAVIDRIMFITHICVAIGFFLLNSIMKKDARSASYNSRSTLTYSYFGSL